ncbi:hypothetical protein [Dokdonella sp.]|uniref:hypothetical protein n=1 Tax=Dokdonella sp. TaxID=2291710 RepID=UPI003783E39A
MGRTLVSSAALDQGFFSTWYHVAAMLLLAALSFCKPALAGAIVVGRGAGCTEPTIQAAIDRAYRLCDQGFCGYNLILVTDEVPDGVYKENVSVPDMSGDPDLSIELVGGYNNCAELAPTGGKASIYRVTVDPILDVRGRTDLRLRNFWIEGGLDGIYWQGHGRIELTDVTVNNHARVGLYLQGEGGEARMELLGGVEVSNNQSVGILAWKNNTVVIRGDRNRIWGTRGGAYPGNGIELQGQAHLEMGATGEVLSDNAGYGLYVDHSGGTAAPTSWLYSTNSANPLAIARNERGAIYYRAVDSTHRVCLKNVAIHHNKNRAFYVTGDRAVLDVNDASCDFPADAAVACAAPQTSAQCNAVADNITATGKPLIAAVGGARIGLHRLLIQGNQNVSSVLSTNLGEARSASSITLTDSVVKGNFARDNLFEALNGGIVDIWDTTVRQNPGLFGTSFVGIAPGLMQMTNGILDQEQNLALLESTDGSTTHFNAVLARNRNGLAKGGDILIGQPTYIDSTGHLSPGSLGVDYALAGGGTDFDGNPRDVDTLGLPNQFGPRDLGAFEFQMAVFDRIFASGFERR